MKQGAAVLVEDYNGKILLMLRDEYAPVLVNQWSTLGGRTNKDETIESAAKREVKEESNLEINKLKFIKKYKFTENDSEINFFHAQTDTRTQKLKLGEGKELRWFSKEEAKKLINTLNYTNQNLQTTLEYIQHNKKSSY